MQKHQIHTYLPKQIFRLAYHWHLGSSLRSWRYCKRTRNKVLAAEPTSERRSCEENGESKTLFRARLSKNSVGLLPRMAVRLKKIINPVKFPRHRYAIWHSLFRIHDVQIPMAIEPAKWTIRSLRCDRLTKWSVYNTFSSGKTAIKV